MNINQFSPIDETTEIIYPNEFGSSKTMLIEQFRKFKELFEKGIDRINQWIDNEKKKYSRNDIINELIDNFNNFGISLKQIEYLKNEYYDYSDIQAMTIYILRRENLIDHDNLDFIMDMLFSFIIVLQSFGSEDYPKKYKKFQFKLIDLKQYFYNNIYTRSKFYNKEALSEITNNLLN